MVNVNISIVIVIVVAARNVQAIIILKKSKDLAMLYIIFEENFKFAIVKNLDEQVVAGVFCVVEGGTSEAHTGGGGRINLLCHDSWSSFIHGRLMASFNNCGLNTQIPSKIFILRPPINFPIKAF